MGCVVAMLHDATFEEEPFCIWGDTEEQVVEVIASYLYAARPVMTDGKRLSLVRAGSLDTVEQVTELLQDVEDIEVIWLSSAPGRDGWLRRPDALRSWLASYGTTLEHAHGRLRPIEDVVVHQDHL